MSTYKSLPKEEQKRRKDIAYNIINEVLNEYPSWKQDNDILLKELPVPITPVALENVDISEKQMAAVNLHPIVKAVLCGTVFGDTSLSYPKNYPNARFQNKHSTEQRAWFIWKNLVILSEFTRLTGVIFTPPDGYQKAPLKKDVAYGKLKIASIQHEKLSKLYGILYKKKKKKIQRFWLNHMNNYFLMTLWLDDGSLTNGRQGQFCLNSMHKDEQEILVKYLSSVWGVKTKTARPSQEVLKSGKNAYVIRFTDQENLMKFLRIIAPVIPVREMLYKVCFAPRDQNLLQRWKTELLTLVKPEFRQDVEKHYADLETKLFGND